MRTYDKHQLSFTTAAAGLGVIYVLTFSLFRHLFIQLIPARLAFEYGGWAIANGAIPYIDIWDPRPPLNYLIPTILTPFSLNNLDVLHSLNISIVVFSYITIVGLIYLLVREITSCKMCSTIAALTFVSIPLFYIYAFGGWSSYHIATAFGLGSIYSAYRDRTFLTGLLGGFSAATYQAASLFLLIGVGIVIASNIKKVRTTLIGLITAVIFVLAPVGLIGGIQSLEAAVVFSGIFPLLLETGDTSALQRLYQIVRIFGYVSIPIGIVFSTYISRREWEADLEGKWVLLGMGTYGLYNLFYEFEGGQGIFMFSVFVALAIGVVVSEIDLDFPKFTHIILALLVLTTILSPIWGFGTSLNTDVKYYQQPNDAPLRDELEVIQKIFGTSQDVAVSPNDRRPELEQRYQSKILPTDCYIPFKGIEEQWFSKTSATKQNKKCGEFDALI
jgi:hypothetical protein